MIRFACPECKKVYKAPDEYAGKKTACKTCGALVVIPERPVREFVYGVSLPPEGTVDASEESEPPPPTPPPSTPRPEPKAARQPPDAARRKRPKRRPPPADWEDDEPIRIGAGRRPWQANAVGGMLIGGGAWAVFWSLLETPYLFPLGCFWPGLYFAIVWAVFAIICGAGLLGDRWLAVNPRTVAILQIVQAVNLDAVNVALGIVSLVFLNQLDAQRRHRGY